MIACTKLLTPCLRRRPGWIHRSSRLVSRLSKSSQLREATSRLDVVRPSHKGDPHAKAAQVRSRHCSRRRSGPGVGTRQSVAIAAPPPLGPCPTTTRPVRALVRPTKPNTSMPPRGPTTDCTVGLRVHFGTALPSSFAAYGVARAPCTADPKQHLLQGLLRSLRESRATAVRQPRQTAMTHGSARTRSP